MNGNIYLKISIVLIIKLFLLWNINSQPLNDTRICIDAGHGGHTSNDRQILLPNGIVYWESEGDFQTAIYLKELLEELGAEVKLTRNDNSDESDISLSERTEIANAFGSDYFHSIHTNGGGGTYSLVLYREENGVPFFQQAKEMGDIMAPVLEDLMKTTAHYNRGDISFLGFNLGVLKFANMPATLSEGSFHDLPDEGLRLKNAEYLKNYAWAIAKSFLEYFEVEGFSTGRVGGVISDATYGTTVNEVTVECVPAGISYTGDNYYNGFYAIGSLAPGNYDLVLSRSGYLNDTTSISIISNEYLDLDLSIQYYNNGFPNVDFFIEGLPAGAGQAISFNGANSTDDGTIVSFYWEFGDGSVLDTGEIVQHAFNQDGIFFVTMTATDDEGNQSSVTKSVEIETFPPSAPKILTVESFNDYNGVSVIWQKSAESNVSTYKIYISTSRDFQDTLEIFEISSDEASFTTDTFGMPGIPYYFRLSAVNIISQESPVGDTYVWYKTGDQENKQDLLIVDGFNRVASYPETTHDFAATYLEALLPLGGFNIGSCSNAAIAGNVTDLAENDIVIWFLGDESTANVTFSETEQSKVRDYLEQGGKLFVTGSEIGWDLVEKGSAEDQAFYREYLKANYQNDGGGGRSPATGIAGSGFDQVMLHFGEVYPEDYPDELGPVEGSSQIMNYYNGAGAGIKYRGTFGASSTEGAVVNLGFPLETVEDTEQLELFMEQLIEFFNSIPSSVPNADIDKALFEVYPTVVSEHVDIYHAFTDKTEAEIFLYDFNGQVYYQNTVRLSTGKSKISILVENIPSGMYFVGIKIPGKLETYKVLIR